MTGRISVVVPTHGRPEALDRLLASVAQSESSGEVVEVVVVEVEVVDSAGAEATPAFSSSGGSGPHAVSNTRSRIPPIRRIILVSAADGRDLSVL